MTVLPDEKLQAYSVTIYEISLHKLEDLPAPTLTPTILKAPFHKAALEYQVQIIQTFPAFSDSNLHQKVH